MRVFVLILSRPEAEGFVYWVCICGFVMEGRLAEPRAPKLAPPKIFFDANSCLNFGGLLNVRLGNPAPIPLPNLGTRHPQFTTHILFDHGYYC